MSRDTEIEELARDFDKNPALKSMLQGIKEDVALEMGISMAELNEILGETAMGAGKGPSHAG